MAQKIDNRLNGGSVEQYVGGNQTNNYYISMFQDNEREFVVTHNANIKPVAYFTGRETELQKLSQRIEEGRKSVLVSGMGGIGKTHICRKLFENYFNKYAKDENGPFRYLGYIEYNGDMDSSLQNCLKFKQQERPEQNQKAAWKELEYLAADGKLLLFVDNVNKPISADPGLQKLRSIPGAVVLTSRQVSFGDEFEPFLIGFLDTKQCKEIYEKIRFGGSEKEVGPEEAPDLKYVIENLAGRHTITVELLAHLARTKRWSAKKLHEKLEETGFCLKFCKDGEMVDIQKSYEKLYDLSELTVAEQNILEAFSLVPYIPLEAEICNEWLLADADVSEDDDVLMGLYQKGWLQFDMEQESYTLHPVFAQFIYEKWKPEWKNHIGFIEACQRRLVIPESGSVLESQKFIPFAESIIKKLKIGNDEKRVNFISDVAYSLYCVAEYKKAEELYEKGLRINERVLGEEHPSTAISYNNLAVVYLSQGKYKKAKELCKKGLRINERVLGEEHPSTATSYNNLAGVYESQGEYKKAEELYKKGLRIRENVLGEEHPDTATSYNNLAGVYESQGKYKKAEELYKKSLRIVGRVLGEEHPDTATSYNNLAGVYESQGKYKKAEELYKKGLRIKENVLGEEHPSTAASYNNLAVLNYKQEKYKTALIYAYKAYKIFSFKFGFNYSYTKSSYKIMKIIYEKCNPEGNFEQWLKEK